MATSPANPPKALLFDIGGVCVVSPFQAILDYELAHHIPPGWVNHAISRTAPSGSWQRLERGEIPLDDLFFAAFKADLSDAALWKEYWAKSQAKKQKQQQQRDDTSLKPPPIPDIDAKALFWQMMRTSRAPDPWMYPALQRLRQSRRFVLAALSNTVIFPAGIKDDMGAVFDSGLRAEGDNVRQVSPGEKVEGQDSANRTQSTDIRECFDVFVSSAHVGMRKPDPRIYEFAVGEVARVGRERGLDIGPSDIVFLDDIGQNLRTARQLGLRTLKVTLGRTRDAVVELQKITGLTLLEDEVLDLETGTVAKAKL